MHCSQANLTWNVISEEEALAKLAPVKKPEPEAKYQNIKSLFKKMKGVAKAYHELEEGWREKFFLTRFATVEEFNREKDYLKQFFYDLTRNAAFLLMNYQDAELTRRFKHIVNRSTIAHSKELKSVFKRSLSYDSCVKWTDTTAPKFSTLPGKDGNRLKNKYFRYRP